MLVVTAHPDDVDFSAGATVASWTSAGIDVAYVVCTSGEAGSVGDTSREAAAVREAEQCKAASLLGVADVTFLRYPDGRLEPDLALRRDVCREIRRFRPQRVLTHSPEYNWQRVETTHPDHLAVGRATLAAVYPDARNPRAHAELAEDGYEPWTVTQIWFMDAPQHLAGHVVEVSATFDAKIEAVRAHGTQTGQMEGLPTRIRFQMRQTAVRHKLPAGSLGEAFHVVSTA